MENCARVQNTGSVLASNGRWLGRTPCSDLVTMCRDCPGLRTTRHGRHRTVKSPLLDQARELASREGGLAVVVTHRADGTAQASVVNAGVLDHPVTGEPAVGFVVQGRARKKLANLRARPVTTIVFRSGWDWVGIEGAVELIGPDDQSGDISSEALPSVFHEIYAAAIGGAPGDWAARDTVIEREGHTAVLVRPTRVYSNPATA